MSRTDIHRPLHVIAQDPSMRNHFREDHRHDDGTCDLQEFLDAWFAGGRYLRTRCSLQWCSAQRICACELCSMRDSRKRARRRDRQGTRRQLHDVSAQWAADELDEDAPHPYRADAW